LRVDGFVSVHAMPGGELVTKPLVMRMLLIDDAVIEFTDGVSRRFHSPRKDPEPVLTVTRPWEENRRLYVYRPGEQTPYQGVTRIKRRIRPISSRDGKRWVLSDAAGPSSHDEYRLGYDHINGQFVVTVKWDGSRSGGHAGLLPVPECGRCVALSTSADRQEWSEAELVFHADERDHELAAERITAAAGEDGPIYIDHPTEYRSEIYNMRTFTYEDMHLALPTFFDISGVGPDTLKPRLLDNGILYPQLAFSRDLRDWQRPPGRPPFIPLSPPDSGLMDRGMIQCSPPVRRDGELWFYYSGSRMGHATSVRRDANGQPVTEASPTSAAVATPKCIEAMPEIAPRAARVTGSWKQRPAS